VKTLIIYDRNYHKLTVDSYSQSYRRQLLALISRFSEGGGTVVELCHDDYIALEPADVIIFYDPHSTHHAIIDGIEDHPAVKYEYFDDPHQREMLGVHNQTGQHIHKLGARQRIERALDRGVSFIICPYYNAFYRFLAPYCVNEQPQLVHFPISPDVTLFSQRSVPLIDRRLSVLANGSVNTADSLYDFRRWAFCRPNVTRIEHSVRANSTPSGIQYPDELLAKFAGALALADYQAVPKYFEMPLAGCVTFMQWNHDAYLAGFRDYVNCVFVEKSNFDERIKHFLNHIIDYQSIADQGRRLVELNYTAQHFAQAIYNHARSHLNDL